MAQLTNFGRNNPLWRRVQRHAQMSTLFGKPHTAVSPIRATTTSLPTEHPILAEASKVAPQSASRQPQPLPTQPSPTTFTPTPTPPAATQEDDANWRRLQKIHQLHQQKAEPAAADPANSRQRQPEETATPASEPPKPAQTERLTKVETAVPTPPSAPTNQPSEQDSGMKAASLSRSPQPNLAQTVGETLQKVAPGQKTDSFVELLPPSRPRPQPKPSPNSSLLTQATQPPAVQRQSKPPTAAPQPHPAPPLRKPTANQGLDTAVSPPPPSAKQTAQPAPPQIIPTDIGPLPSDLWELLGEPMPPMPEPSAAVTTAVPSPTTPPPTSHRQAKATPPKTAAFTPPPTAGPIAATAVAAKPPKSAARPIAKPVNRPTASPNLPAFLDETSLAEQSAAAMPIVQRMPETAPAKPTALPQTESANPTAVPHHAAPPNPPGTTTLNPVPLEQALRLTSTPTPQTVRQGELARHIAQPTPAPQPDIQSLPTPAIQRSEQPPPPVIQRLPDLGASMGELETAVAHNTPSAIATPLTTAANALLEESEPETETEPANATDLDLDELSRQVYQALKRKLAIERERGYGR